MPPMLYSEHKNIQLRTYEYVITYLHIAVEGDDIKILKNLFTTENCTLRPR